MTPRVWAFDVDGCLIDALTGESLRPYARRVLERLRAQGATVVLWSAGGGDYARRRAEAHGIDHLVDACYDKDARGADGRYVVTHLALVHRPDVCVDDQPDDVPADVDRVAVAPYVAHDPHDRALALLLEGIAS
jgi:long-chain acyl-CoA synthetase